MRVLMVSRYVQPNAKFANSNVYRQAKSLLSDHGVSAEVLTWPRNDGWRGPIPYTAGDLNTPPVRVDAGGLVFWVINPPWEWGERTLSPGEWARAVEFGMCILSNLRPDIVHLQHWVGLWWMLESAQRLKIPTVYSNHDWGIACLRTLLVMGDDSLCDGKLAADKCAKCIWQGRGVLGRANELLVGTAAGRWLVQGLYSSPLKSALQRQGILRLPLRERVALNFSRARQILGNLDAMFTPSEFGRTFFSNLGVPANRIWVKPWYNDPVETRKLVAPSQPFTITCIGRVSPEKGVHRALDALGMVKSIAPVKLIIAGADTSVYCLELQRKYGGQVGPHRVQWLGWVDSQSLYLGTDVVIIPSSGVDNTPLTLVEALSFRVPVISTRVSPIEELVTDGENGYLADYNSVKSLAAAIERAAAAKNIIRSGAMTFRRIDTCREYSRALRDAYRFVCRVS